MTLIELQKVLGDGVSKMQGLQDIKDAETRSMLVTQAEMIAKLSKQMINNADVILRADKLVAEGKLAEDSSTAKIVG